MRKTMTGMAAALAVLTVTAMPAMAGCGGYSYSGCSTGCGATAYVDPCGHSGHSGHYERLSSPTYYYVNQGPTHTGPGAFAPFPSYQERAVSGWSAYSRPYYYGYNGGPYANASHHYYDGARVSGPVVYSYRGRSHFRPHRTSYHHAVRPMVRHFHGPRHFHAPRHVGHHHHRHHGPVLRRYN